MRSHILFGGAAFAALTSSTAYAADGKYSAQLGQMLTAIAAGKCSPDMMGAGLLAACQAQLPAMSAGVAQLGKIDTISFVSSQDTDKGPVETYAIKYASGQTVHWLIGQFANGKFETLGTNGS
ncbi:MAG TPA: hypothetical protein VK533_12740 [Sphingomonas sp.]|uniref:hypothetical protein n=1 Tax=Sphingomonas sp. TaxID=28214 RepID=UPI002B8567FC|nr:hypothetical protein [Sphingomonas sp.]HMI20405.1 hypothetical protein [Sphingomonas sp.]